MMQNTAIGRDDAIENWREEKKSKYVRHISSRDHFVWRMVGLDI